MVIAMFILMPIFFFYEQHYDRPPIMQKNISDFNHDYDLCI